eukprot:CAMPEP_0167778980 /NCGR_PEP_ID=MMETSP0111_2-20121227/4556_1 /TAXON_ID=91324 /ORGANISM="Lotharella globosa, Strain CCCM811" /LENGTH=537 /DNA_ID=CAMNT_0007669347 /DNA_START=24 /DNA_END=1637 /DNA_ORIENTATION=+
MADVKVNHASRKRKRKLEMLRPETLCLEDVRSIKDAKFAPLPNMQRANSMDEMMELEGPRDLKDNIMKINKIASGTTSTVHLALHAGTMRLVAVKERVMAEEQCDRVIQELQELHDNLVPIDEHGAPQWIFNHYKSIGTVHPCKHILSFYGAYHDAEAGTANFCCEYMDSGSLQRAVDGGGVRDESILQHISYGVLKALEHLQEYNTIHNDIKPANILVSHMGDVKVGDLGLALKVDGMSTDCCGTLAFCSPERLMSQPHSFPADIWAFGITLIAVASGKMPFSNSTGFVHLQEMVVNKPIPGLGPAKRKRDWVLRFDGIHSKMWSPAFMTFVTCMLIKDPAKRHSAKQLLNHQFLRTYNPKQFENPNGVLKAAWRKCIGTHAIDGEKLLPEITKKLRKHVDTAGGMLCRRITPVKTPEVSEDPSSKLRRQKAEGRWKKLKTRFLPTTNFRTHPFVGVWEGVINLASGLRLPTLTVEMALGLRASKSDQPEMIEDNAEDCIQKQLVFNGKHAISGEATKVPLRNEMGKAPEKKVRVV